MAEDKEGDEIVVVVVEQGHRMKATVKVMRDGEVEKGGSRGRREKGREEEGRN